MAGVLCSAALLIACSEQPKPGPPTEQELHSTDVGAFGSVRGRHLFRCRDGGEMLVDFKEQGLFLEIRAREGDPPVTLTAPSQGLQYIGDGGSATMAAGELRFVPLVGEERICTRRTR